MIWQSEIGESNTVETEIQKAQPFTTYVCKVAAFNTYGIGIFGSNNIVETPESGVWYGGMRACVYECM